jgi:hypothetical protein
MGSIMMELMELVELVEMMGVMKMMEMDSLLAGGYRSEHRHS